eukprot:gene4532-10117_t
MRAWVQPGGCVRGCSPADACVVCSPADACVGAALTVEVHPRAAAATAGSARASLT